MNWLNRSSLMSWLGVSFLRTSSSAGSKLDRWMLYWTLLVTLDPPSPDEMDKTQLIEQFTYSPWSMIVPLTEWHGTSIANIFPHSGN